MKEKLRKFFRAVLLSLFLMNTTFAAQSGWKKINSKGILYYKPFVKIRRKKNITVIFVTSEGKIYKGRCRKIKSIKDSCDAMPGKKFDSPFYEITYIILEFNSHLPPKLKKSGKLGSKIEEK